MSQFTIACLPSTLRPSSSRIAKRNFIGEKMIDVILFVWILVQKSGRKFVTIVNDRGRSRRDPFLGKDLVMFR